MNKQLHLICFIVLISTIQTFSQSPDWLWAKGIGATLYVNANSIATDASGNVYCAGAFNGTGDFDPGTGVFMMTAPGGAANMFICKLGASGNFVWGITVGGASNLAAGFSIVYDTSGSGYIYVTGRFSGLVDFDPGVGTYNLTSTGSNDIFIAKFNSSANFIWAKRMGGPGSNSYGNSIKLNNSGNGDIYTTGLFNGTVDFDPSTGVYSLTSAGGDDIFVSKLSSSGNFIWAKRMGGTGNATGLAIAVGSAEIYTTGRFDGTADFDPGAGAFNLTSNGTYDIFISKLDSSGNFAWAAQMGGATSDCGYSLTVDLSGNVYTTGSFSGTVDFDPGTGTLNLSSSGTADIFISKLSNSGNLVWAKAMGGTNGAAGSSITLDDLGNIYTVGSFSGSADFDPGVGVFNLTSVGSGDIFISKVNNVGNFVWAKAIGGTIQDLGKSINLDPSGMVYVLGEFNSATITIGSTTLTNVNPLGVFPDIIIAKLDTAIVTGINEIGNFSNLLLLSPNPLTNTTTISFTLSQSQKASLNIFDVNGRLVSTLADKIFEAGEHQIEFNAEKLDAGIYFLKMQAGEFLKTEKLIVTK